MRRGCVRRLCERALAEVVSLRSIEARRHVVIVGPVGVGKIFVASALGYLACQLRRRMLTMNAHAQ